MLSDACADFISQIDHAAASLAEAVSWYGSDNYAATYRDQTDALLQACARVREAPYDDRARVELLGIAASVMRSYDAPSGTSNWC